MSLWDDIEVCSTDGKTWYEEGVDYEIDRENDTIARIDDSSIPDGGQVTVRYKKGVSGGVLESLFESGHAVMPPTKAIVKILSNPTEDLFTGGTDLSGKIVSIELAQKLTSEPDTFRFLISDPALYSECDPANDVIIGMAFGEIDSEGGEHYTECFRGLVYEREFVANPDGGHFVGITAKDFSIVMDAPRQSAMNRTWHPTLRREVFLNGAIIADDYRAIRSSSIFNDLDFDDVMEIVFAKEHPRAHGIIRECFDSISGDCLNKLVIDCLDFPVVYLDAQEKTPGDVIRELASLAGASVKAEGNTLVVSERGFPDGFMTAWVYDAIAVYCEEENRTADADFTAVQIFGHSETVRLPTKSSYIPPTDFTQPGWCRVVDEEGTLEPSEPIRSDEYPQPAELHFQIDGNLYYPSTVKVIGGELACAPEVKIIDGVPVIDVTVLIEWMVDDKTGDCPYIEDEDGNKLFRIRGRIYDAVPDSNGEFLPISEAMVRREKLDGDDAGDTFDINSDEDGYFIFEAVPLGEYKIIASAPGYYDNFSDTDPANDEYRDLVEELIEYEEEIEKGRYEKLPTDYHVIVWARPKVSMGPLADLTVSQVLLEVRDEETKSGKTLVYAPAIRDERITTEVLAERVGKILIESSSQDSPCVKLRLPLNRWLSAGDGIRITGDALDLPLWESRPFQATEVRKIFEPEKGYAHDIVSSFVGEVGLFLSKGLREDPLDTRIGSVIATYRNELGWRIYDVASGGKIFYGLKSGAVVGELAVGETVQIAKATTGALSYMIVARSTEVFGEGRIRYV